MAVGRLSIQMGIICLSFGFVISPGSWFRNSPTLSVAHSVARHLIYGKLNGNHNKPDVQVNFRKALPGDILLCHNADGGYGYWTHAVLYVGKNRVVDANDFSHGTILQDSSHYDAYDEVILLRPNVLAKVREEAAQVALIKVGTPYDPLSALKDTHSTYCSKLIWEVYKKVGVQLCTANGWVLPDQIAANAHMIRIARWGSSGGDANQCGS